MERRTPEQLGLKFRSFYSGSRRSNPFVVSRRAAGYNGCRSLLKLSDTYAIERIEKACQRALSCVSHPRYKNSKLILEAGQDLLEIKPKRQTDTAFGYVRGASYYGGQTK